MELMPSLANPESALKLVGIRMASAYVLRGTLT